jgi:hypothetical protein
MGGPVVKPCIERLTPRSVGGRLSFVAALVMLIWCATSGVSAAEPLLRLRIEDVSVVAIFSDNNGYVRVEASKVTVNGEPQVILDVLSVDNVTQTTTCGFAIAPSSVLETASRTTRLQADLSSVQWVSVCDEIAGPPLGIIDLTFTPDGFMRTRTTGTVHRWLPTLVVQSVGTSEEESVQVTGQLLNAVTPVQFISGQVSVSNTRFISIERR